MKPERNLWALIRYWGGIGLLCLVVLVALQNIAEIEFNFLLWGLRMPGVVLVFVSFGIGAICGWIFHASRPRRG